MKKSCPFIAQFQKKIGRKYAQQKDQNDHGTVQKQPDILVLPYVFFRAEYGRVSHAAIKVAGIGSLDAISVRPWDEKETVCIPVSLSRISGFPMPASNVPLIYSR